MIAVISAPRRTAIRRLFVSIPRNWLILLPAVFCIPSAMMFIPYRNIPSPPIKLNRLDMSLTDIVTSL